MEALAIIGIRPFGMMNVPETTNAWTPPKLLMSFLLLASCSQMRGCVVGVSIYVFAVLHSVREIQSKIRLHVLLVNDKWTR